MRQAWAIACVLVAAAGCNPFTVDKGPYGNFCPAASANHHYCGECAATSQCTYCPDNAVGGSTCPSDPCADKCDSSAGGGRRQAAAARAAPAAAARAAPAAAAASCATAPAPRSAPPTRSSSARNTSPRASARSSRAPAMATRRPRTAASSIARRRRLRWCGGGYNMACSAIGVQACATTVAQACQ